MVYFKTIHFFWNESGATAIEYGLIAAAVSVAIAVSLFLFGDHLNALFQAFVDVMASVTASMA